MKRHSIIRSVVASLMLTHFAVPAIAADGGAPFIDPVGNFTVDYRQLPRVTTMAGTSLLGEKVPITTYSLQDNSSLMMVEDTPVLDRTSTSAQILNKVGNAILNDAASRNRIVEYDMPDMLDGQLGRTFSIRRPDGSLETARVFNFNGHLYRLVTMLAGGDHTRTADALHFSQSLHLTAPRSQ